MCTGKKISQIVMKIEDECIHGHCNFFMMNSDLDPPRLAE